MTTHERTTIFEQAVGHYNNKTGWFGGRNWSEAVRLFLEIVEDDIEDEYYSEALYYLGDIYRVGGNKISQDEHAAVMYYTSAILAQNPRAMVALGDMYAGRLGGLIGGAPSAESLYLQALALGFDQAQPQLDALRSAVASREGWKSTASATKTMVEAGMAVSHTLTQGEHGRRIAELEEMVSKLNGTINNLSDAINELKRGQFT